MSSFLCKVKGCRFSNTHIAAGHRCGTCGKFGHGQVECKNPTAYNYLMDTTKDDLLPKMMHCSSNGCTSIDTHTIEAHVCLVCSERHPQEECPVSPAPKRDYTIGNIMAESTTGHFTSQFASAKESLGDAPGKKYTTVYAGMGCSLYIKRSSHTAPLYGYFMHTDSWGQYGPKSDDRPTLELFLKGFTKV